MPLKKFTIHYSLFTILTAATIAHAQTPTGPLPQSAEQTASFLAPFTDPDTLLLAHADLDLLSLPDLYAFLNQLLTKIPNTDDLRKQLPLSQTAAAAIFARLHTLGVRHIYLLSDQSDLTISMFNPSIASLGGAILVPLPPNADPKPLLNFCHEIGIHQSLGTEDPVILPGNILVLTGNPPLLDRFKKPSASPIPLKTLTAAFTSADPSVLPALQIVALLSSDNRRVLTEIPFTLPPEVGGQPSTTFTDGLLAATLSLHLPPNPSIAIRLSTENPAAAARIAAATNGLLTAIPKTPWFTHDLQTTPPETKTALQTLLTTQHFTPTDSSATLTLTTDTLTTALNTLLAPNFAAATERDLRSRSASNLRQVMVAAFNYQSAHEGQFPPTLQTLIDQKLLTNPALLQSPRNLKDKSLTYHPWTPDQLKKITPSESPMIWEHPDTPTDGLNVAFADGHIEFMRQQKSVDDLLHDAETKAAK